VAAEQQQISHRQAFWSLKLPFLLNDHWKGIPAFIITSKTLRLPSTNAS